jgi:VWFA-related protein
MHQLFFVFVFMMVGGSTCGAWQQQGKPVLKQPARADQETPQEQEPIKVRTEEVHIPVLTLDEFGHFDPTLTAEDLMIREDGVIQEIRGLFRLPASVLLLLDTGGEVNPIKTVRMTRQVATQLISNLKKDDLVSVLQFNSRTEIVQDWTADKMEAIKALDRKLFPGKRAVLSEAIALAALRLQDMPAGSRHLVLISDGVETPAESVQYKDVIKDLIEAGVTVHVISYTSLLGVMKKQFRTSRPREGSRVPEEVIMSLPRNKRPNDPRPDLVDQLRAKGGTTIDLDPAQSRRRKQYEIAVERSEKRLTELTRETGGGIWLPNSLAEMINHSGEVAREIDSQYIITYKPKRPITSGVFGTYRRVDVISRRNGLRVRSRRSYIAPRDQ